MQVVTATNPQGRQEVFHVDEPELLNEGIAELKRRGYTNIRVDGVGDDDTPERPDTYHKKKHQDMYHRHATPEDIREKHRQEAEMARKHRHQPHHQPYHQPHHQDYRRYHQEEPRRGGYQPFRPHFVRPVFIKRLGWR